MIKAIFPGSFDPITYGHLNIIERASKIVDFLTILIVSNSEKKTFFTVDERLEQAKYLTKKYDNTEVVSSDGLTAEFARKNDAKIMIRGLRNGTDFDYELQIAEANKRIAPDIETLFISTIPEYSYLSSKVVKEIFRYGGNIEGMVDRHVIEKMTEKIEQIEQIEQIEKT